MSISKMKSSTNKKERESILSPTKAAFGEFSGFWGHIQSQYFREIGPEDVDETLEALSEGN